MVFPASHCPACLHPLAWYENIPVLSFVFLRGRCSHCRRPISIQYPLVEAATACLFGFWVLRFPEPNFGNLLSGMIFLSFLVLLATADLKWFILPHPMNNLFVATGLLSFWLRRGEWGSRNFKDSLIAFAVLGAVFLLVDWFWPDRLGGGDIKMMTGLGAWLGLNGSFAALMVAYGLGALLGLLGLFFRRAGWKTRFPFGPFLSVGGLVSVLCPCVFWGWIG